MASSSFSGTWSLSVRSDAISLAVGNHPYLWRKVGLCFLWTCLKGLGKLAFSCWCKFTGTQLQASCLFSAFVRVHFCTVVSLPGHLSAMRSHCKFWVLAPGVWTAKAVLLVDHTSARVKPHRLFSSAWAVTFTPAHPNPLCCSFFVLKSLIRLPSSSRKSLVLIFGSLWPHM